MFWGIKRDFWRNPLPQQGYPNPTLNILCRVSMDTTTGYLVPTINNWVQGVGEGQGMQHWRCPQQGIVSRFILKTRNFHPTLPLLLSAQEEFQCINYIPHIVNRVVTLDLRGINGAYHCRLGYMGKLLTGLPFLIRGNREGNSQIQVGV